MLKSGSTAPRSPIPAEPFFSSLLWIVGSSLQKCSMKWREDNKAKTQCMVIFFFPREDGVSLDLCIPQSPGLSVVPNKSGW